MEVQKWTQPRSKFLGIALQKGMQKSDDGTLLVRGFFTSDNKDEVGDIITRAATERALPKYRQWGNIRYMHQPRPVAVVTRIGTEDGLEWNEVEIKVIDPQAVFEVENGLLKALSVGILIKFDDVDFLEDGGLIINDYTLAEISLVDHPANYDAALKTASASEGIAHLVRNFGMDTVAQSFQNILEREIDAMPTDINANETEHVEVPVENQTEEAPVVEETPAEPVVIENAAEAEEVEAPVVEGTPVSPDPEPEAAPIEEDDTKTILRDLVSQVKTLTELVSALSKSAPEAQAEVQDAPAQSVGGEPVEKAAVTELPEAEPGAPVNRVGGVPETELPVVPASQADTRGKATGLRDALQKYFELRNS